MPTKNSDDIVHLQSKGNYNFYSHIHRFMRQYLADFEKNAARVDFSNQEQRQLLSQQFKEFLNLLENHAGHEDRTYHPMLKDKEPQLTDVV